jgi:hypothetical protein
MTDRRSALDRWTPEQIAAGRKWVDTWRVAGKELERIRRKELRELDTYRALVLLAGPVHAGVAPPPPAPTSGLVEQQRWFMQAARHL